MSRAEFRQTIYQDLSTDPTYSALLALLGPVTAQNRRIYSAWPQETPQLSGIEPDEGWLVFHESHTTIVWTTVQQEMFFNFRVLSARGTLGDAVMDILDPLYHWKLGGQNSRLFGEWKVIRSQRVQSWNDFDTARKLYHSAIQYRFHVSGLRRQTA